MKYDQRLQTLLTEIIHWAKSQEDIKGIALVGSYGRNMAKADSDVDLIIIAKNHKNYLQNVSWLNKFGQIDKMMSQEYGKVTSLHVQYENSYEVEFGITTSKWVHIPTDKGTRKVVENGIKVLYDPYYMFAKFIAYIQQDEQEY